MENYLKTYVILEFRDKKQVSLLFKDQKECDFCIISWW